ncbi:hypothetical protein CEE88_06865 [Lactobacillus crispatus]|jgi:hypothetical protein|nr:hypothetical protein [Lactobacillus crispatus]EEU28340.1 hypothetical protein HMPREF0507_01238 [Lactobacillus crispatus MV-1A-US]EKB68159.1 hypothetical protein HMPREF9250_00835 [Lactobacillus crispatus FB049-03]CPR96258.1 Uncharacterised protein [Chlamydia trachomatis]DAO82275.1 MAG TPA: hypothetical protein [Bacteriophage sp.]AZR15706.1 hypothetical protein C3K22_06895 [Lactobacillus crispatus]
MDMKQDEWKSKPIIEITQKDVERMTLDELKRTQVNLLIERLYVASYDDWSKYAYMSGLVDGELIRRLG